jgi:iron-sulfur cluster repair protein YtfE (RIC family)
MAGVVTLLKEDHQKLEQVFKEVESGEGDIHELLHQVAELLIPHSKAEEEVVYPAIKDLVPAETGEVNHSLEEHHHAEQVLKRLLSLNSDEALADEELETLIADVRHHIEEEEQEILPQLSETASNKQLGEIGDEFTAHKERALAQLH